MKKDTSKDLWESMKKKYQGNERVKSAQLQRLRRNFEILEMRRGEKIEDYIARVMEITNDMRNLGEEMPDFKVVEKILRTLTEKFTYVVCAIEESNDVKTLTVDGLQSSLTVHELNLTKDEAEEKVLKVEGQYWRSDGFRGRGGNSIRGRGRGSYQGRGRGNTSRNMIECYKCHKMGHYKSECPSWEKEANYVEMEEDLLLMAHVDHDQTEERQIWFLDSGCSNHMCGTKDWFIDLDQSFKQNVKLGDDRKMAVEGRGKLRLEINGRTQVISDVYFVPELKNNLFSVGQLQQKGLRIIIEDDSCEVWHKKERKMVMYSTMTKNRMFVILATVRKPREMEEGKCLQVIEKSDKLWHKRFGQLNHKGLRSLAEKEMDENYGHILDCNLMREDLQTSLIGEEDDEKEDDEIEEEDEPQGGGYSRGNERFQKRQKPNKPVSSGYEFAGPSDARVSYDWREQETFVLLEVWGDRFLQLSRRSLRNEDWNEVAEKVSEELRSERSEAQCRRMIDELKRKYRKEKTKIEKSGLGSSKWSFFNKLDMLLGSSSKSELGLACGVDSGEFVFMNSKVYLDKSNGFDEMMDSPGDSEDDDDDNDDGNDREADYERKKLNDAASYKLLAESVESFGKIYEKMEKSKKDQMKALEKMRADFQKDLELQKKQIVDRAQTEIARLHEEQENHDGESEDEEMENDSDVNLSEE